MSDDGWTVDDVNATGSLRRMYHALYGRMLPHSGKPTITRPPEMDLSGKDIIVAPEYEAAAREAFPPGPKAPRILVCRAFDDPTQCYIVERDAFDQREWFRSGNTDQPASG